MINPVSQKPLEVKSGGKAGPYLMLPVSQRDGVCALLDARGFSYWVDDFSISLNRKPPVTVINFEVGTDRDEIQKLLGDAS